MITNTIPASWQELQREVMLILEQCGFEVEMEKKVKLSRGQVELDVFAQENIKGRKYTIICECKYWKSKIPQHIIHSFRTVVQDAGANIGYVISLAGFQEGSISASEFSNIELLTWVEFQQQFMESWYRNYFSPEFTRQTNSFATYVEPLFPKWFIEMSAADRKAFLALKEYYDFLGPLIMHFSIYLNMFNNERELPRLPLADEFKGRHAAFLNEKLPEKILKADTYREFMAGLLEYIEQALVKFRYFRDKYYQPEEEF